ncbi:MAG: T9SS type A sorting domain-containing protein [Cytophagales bacterium]|nr:T9SS type A sorting domain-containing protein [Cytophagales bacterium]
MKKLLTLLFTALFVYPVRLFAAGRSAKLQPVKSFLKTLFVVVILSNGANYAFAQAIIYSESFTGGTIYCPGNPQYDNWVTFRSQLDTLVNNFTSVTIRGSLDTVGITCSDPATVKQMAAALMNGSIGSWTCGGNTWGVGVTGCGSGCSIAADRIEFYAGPGAPSACSCTAPYSVRPCIGNSNWGGITVICSPPTQTMTVIFGYEIGPNVLIIWDDVVTNPNTQSLKTALQNAGMTVTMSATDELSYDGTNPPLAGFDAVIHLNGTTWAAEMLAAGQNAIVSFVQDSGGIFLGSEWNAYEILQGRMLAMQDLILFDRTTAGGVTSSYIEVPAQASHPILANVPATFAITYDNTTDDSLHFFPINPSTTLMKDDQGRDVVAVRYFGSGRVVGFYHTGNSAGETTLSDTNIQQLYIDAILWALPIVTYCTPTYTTGCATDFIDRVEFAGIDNSPAGTGCNGNPDNYIFYSADTAKVGQGSFYPITLTPTTSAPQGFGVWIDFNQDGDISDAGEFVFSAAAGTVPVGGTIYIPGTTTPGATRLRVRCIFGTTPVAGDSCNNYTWGETEDYNILIQAQLTVDVGVIAIDAPISGCGLTATESVTIRVSNFGSVLLDTIPVSYRINAGPAVNETIFDTINPGDTLIYTFAATADLSTTGIYIFDAWTSLAGDTVNFNDSLSNFDIYNQLKVCIFDAVGGSGDTTCSSFTNDLCTDGFVTNDTTLKSSDPFTLTTTKIDSIDFYLYYTDCTPGDTVNFTFYLNGIPIGLYQDITFTCTCTPVIYPFKFTITDTATLNAALNPGLNTLSVKNDGIVNMNIAGYTATIYGACAPPFDCVSDEYTAMTDPAGSGADYVGQSFIANVNTIDTVGVWLSPWVGPNQIKFGIAPDDGAGNPDETAVLWMSGLINLPVAGQWVYIGGLGIPVTPGLVYHVLIDTTGGGDYMVGYSTTDTTDTGEDLKFSGDGGVTWALFSFPMAIYVNGDCAPSSADDVGVIAIDAPTSGCNLSATEAVTVRVKNFGTTVQDSIPVSFNDGTGAVTETIPDSLNPGDTISYTFTATSNLLAPGTYFFDAWTGLVGDVDNFNDTIATTLTVNPNPVINSFTLTSIGCTPLNNTLCVATTGADTLFWDFGDGNYDTTFLDTCLYHLYTNLTDSAIVYNPILLVENSFGCTDTATTTVTVLPLVTAAFTASPDTGCHPFTVDFQNISVGAATYEWDFGDGFSSTDTNPTHIFTNTASLVDSIYTVSLIATGFPICKDTTIQQILVHPTPTASYTVSDTVGCVGDTGFFTNTSTGATSYLWQVDGFTFSTDTNAFVLAPAPAIYALRLIVSDGVCSDTSAETIITVYALPTVAGITGTDLSCAAANDGAADLTASGGAPPYAYNWSNGDTIEDIMGLSVGAYTVIITDMNGCSATGSVTLSALSGLSIVTASSAASCLSICNGTATGIAISGTEPYTHLWDDPAAQTNSTATGLCAGTYTVIATDSAGCTDTATVIVGSPPEMILSITPTNSTCGNADGSASVSVSNGTPPYTYAWSSGDTLDIADSLSSGIYVVTVTDVNGCSNFALATISDSDGPEINNVFSTDITCNDGSDGAITITVIGGTQPYAYLWSNGSTDPFISNLVAGPYEVTVTDSNGCITNQSVTLTEPNAFSYLITTTDANCSNNDGSASVSVSGGTGAYTYAWSSGDTLLFADSLAAGVYTLTVTDFSSCTDSVNVAVSNVGGATITIDSIIDGGCGASLGSIYISLTGGSGIFTYLWSDGSINEDLVNVSSGTYNVTVTDTNNCIATASAHISGIPSVEASICLVTVDSATGKNLIVWEKTQTEGVLSYNIYKESSQVDVYYLIGNVPVNTTSVFVDSLSDPAIRSWRYKMQVVDSCLNESELSADHKTMHLNINLGIPPAINLIWDHYEGDFPFLTYYVLRYTALTGWDTLSALASNLTSYTDPTPPNEDLYYFVEVKHPTGCDPNMSKVLTYNSARSNVSNRLLPTGIPPQVPGVENLSNFKVYPNPYTGKTKIAYILHEHANVLLEVYNVLGKKVQVLVNEPQNIGKHQIDFSANDLGYSPGVYILKLRVGDTLYMKKLMEY